MESCSLDVCLVIWALVSLCLTILSPLDNTTDLFLFQSHLDFNDDNWAFSDSQLPSDLH